MFVAVSRIKFETHQTPYDHRELKSLIEKIKSRFQVCAKINQTSEQWADSIVISTLEVSQKNLDQKLDKISEFCEESGFGRIESEEVFYEHIENLFE